MNKEQLHRMVDSEEAIAASREGDIHLLIDRFPYFQTSRILLLKKIKLAGASSFDKELKKSGVYIRDRAKLYTYLHPLRVKKSGEGFDFLSKESIDDSLVTSTFSMGSQDSFNYLFLAPDEVGPVKTYAASDPLKELEQKEDQFGDQGEKGWDLIDRFVQHGRERLVMEDDASPVPNLAEEFGKENSTFLTETLASIHIKQKNYEKAIAIFEGLSLKYPEKSAYFAARIKELELLVKHI